MGPKQSKAGDKPPCSGNEHQYKPYTCMSDNCEQATMICNNKFCGFVSSRNPRLVFCQLCKIAQEMETNSVDDEDVLSAPQLQHAASVTFDPKNKTFEYNKDFFTKIALAEGQSPEEIKQQFERVAQSMEFDNNRDDDQDGIRPPGDFDPQSQGQEGPQLISHFSEVRKIGEKEFLFAHKTDEMKNIVVTIQGEGEDFEWVGLPQAWQSTLDTRFERPFQQKHPDVALRVILAEQVQAVDGLRPFAEIQQLLTNACTIQKENPALKYKILGKIGRGAFGAVFKCLRHEDQKVFALKFTNPKSRAERQDVINEVSLIQYLNCEQLIQCEEVYDYQNRLWIFLELMDGGEMTKIVLAKNGNFSEDFCKWSLYQVALGLQGMHKHNVLHRDIKSDNVLCNADGTIKIADMGFSIFLSEQQQYRQSQKGTPSWVSPEIAKGVTYSKEVDVWAMGCFAFELASGNPPFSANTQDMDALFEAIIYQASPRLPGAWSDKFTDFVDRCLIKDPKQRWSIDQLLAHEFMQDAPSAREGWIQDYTAWQATLPKKKE